MRALKPNEIDLLERIIEKPELQQFFFKKVKGLHWFYPLEENGFFNPELNPKPIQSEDEKYYRIPSWHTTDYLVSTSEELSDPANEEYAVKFLEIIEKATLFA